MCNMPTKNNGTLSTVNIFPFLPFYKYLCAVYALRYSGEDK